jgi:hypothetical protein
VGSVHLNEADIFRYRPTLLIAEYIAKDYWHGMIETKEHEAVTVINLWALSIAWRTQNSLSEKVSREQNPAVPIWLDVRLTTNKQSAPTPRWLLFRPNGHDCYH